MENKGDILIVDDSRVSLEVMTDILSTEGYRTRQADSGALALEFIAATPPDLILLDINMPGMDGFTVLRHLKANETNSRIPVILISASADIEKQVSGVMRGVIDFILKPFQAVELLVRVRTQLELARLHISLEQRAAELQRVNEALQLEIVRREEVERAEFRLLDIVDKSLNEIYVFDAVTLKFHYLNQGALQNLGYSIREMPLLTPLDITPESSEAAYRELLQPLVTGGQEILVYETTHCRKNGSLYPVEIHLQLNRQDTDADFLAIVIDITERKQAEEALRASESYIKAVMDSLPLGIAVNSLDPAVKFEYMNDNFPLIYRTSREALADSDSFWDSVYEDPVFREEIRQRILDDCASGDPQRMHWEAVPLTRTGAATTYISASNIPVPGKPLMISAVWDVTEQKASEEARLRLEKQMLNTQKLESLGVLAGGIAHDFNNILMTVMGNASLALMRLSADSPAVDNLKQIELAADKAAKLAQQMLAYSGKGKFVIESLDLSHLVEEMAQMLEVSISKKVLLRYNFGRGLPLVEADATQMRQVIMNLVINASEAIGERSGIIAITTGAIDCDRSYLDKVWFDDQLPAGLYTFLEVADTGCGMDKETIGRLFDPFFTTKFTGRGLGMAAVLGIVRGHKGAIKVYSEPGKGTTFKVLLPATGLPTANVPDGQADAGWQGIGTVLLVDDEETVRAVGKQMLLALGYDVLLAADGLEALSVFQAHSGITHIILDLTMPHLGGEDTFRELRQLDPQARIIMSSGYNELEISQKFAGKGLTGFIQKPYTLATLREVLKKVGG